MSFPSLSIAARPAIASVLHDPASATAAERAEIAQLLERWSRGLFARAERLEAARNVLTLNMITRSRERAMELAADAERLRQYQEG